MTFMSKDLLIDKFGYLNVINVNVRKQWYTFNTLCFVLASGVVFNDVYTASKFAMEGFCESLAVQLMKFNIR